MYDDATQNNKLMSTMNKPEHDLTNIYIPGIPLSHQTKRCLEIYYVHGTLVFLFLNFSNAE